MNIEVLAWTDTKARFESGIVTIIVPDTGRPLAEMVNGKLVPHPGLYLDPIGEVVKTPAVHGPGGPTDIVTPAVMIKGYHVNCRFFDKLADALIEDLPQTDAEGNLLPLFERTHFVDFFPGSVWENPKGDGVPGGYVGTKKIKLFDPALIISRDRVWA